MTTQEKIKLYKADLIKWLKSREYFPGDPEPKPVGFDEWTSTQIKKQTQKEFNEQLDSRK